MALDTIKGKQIPICMDSLLKDDYSFEGATALTQLASRCLLNNPKDRPTIEVVNGILALCQSNTGAPSNAMPGTQEQDKTPPMQGAERQDKTSPIRGTQKQDKTSPMLSSSKKNTTPLMQGTQKHDKTPPMLSSPMQDAAPSMQGTQKQDRTPQTPPVPQPATFPMAEAVARVDLTAIHHNLVLARYDGDEASGELSFKDWTTHMMEMLETRKRGDLAFRDKDLKTAIKCYSQFLDEEKLVSATVRVRRSLCYLMSDQPELALSDAMQAQYIQERWPTPFYMQAVALCQLNMNSESADTLKEATALEKQRLMNTR